MSMAKFSTRYRGETANPSLIKLFAPSGAPNHYVYDNNGDNGQYQCKVCKQTFCESNFVTKPITILCP
jgi:hypothetical protein